MQGYVLVSKLSAFVTRQVCMWLTNLLTEVKPTYVFTILLGI